MTVRERLLPRLTVADELGAGAVTAGRLELGGLPAMAALWDFGVAGGTCGVAEADAMLRIVDRSISERLPLVTVLASGGTRLTEGMRALVGIPRMALALDRLRADRLPHLSVADAPTTGGVWVAVGCSADLRAGVAGATVAFSGPRVVEAMTGTPLATGAGTAEAARAAGLLDAVADEAGAVEWLTRALAAVSPGDHRHAELREGPEAAEPGVMAAAAASARAGLAVAGGALVDRLLADPVELGAADATVRAAVGRLVDKTGPTAVVVALAAQPAAMVTSAGFGLLSRAAQLADTLDAPLVTLVDTIGGDPHETVVPAEILAATRALLGCRAPTVALVHGAGGSGGALAAAVCDRVLVGPDGWFGALAPTGAAAALRKPLDEVLDLLRPAPAQLAADGFADASYDAGEEVAVTCRAVGELRGMDPVERLRRRDERWSAALAPRV